MSLSSAVQRTIASIAVFEGPAPSHEEFVTHIAGRLPLVARFRQRVRQVPFDLAVVIPLHGGAEYVGRSPGLGDELAR